jgi:D-alanyl-D-alanine carboxypeptidase
MKHLLKFPILIILLFSSSASSAQSSGNLQLDTLLSNTLDSMRTVLNAKSLSAAIQFPDTAVWADASGISGAGVNVTTDDAYLIGSVTKTITSACILQLVDQGILSLDDSLHEWLDTIQYINPDITIRQLLRHQSGLYDVLNNPACQPALIGNTSAIWSANDLITNFILPPVASAGGVWNYCNTNYFLLGMIIESATGNPYYVELRNRFYGNYGYTTFGIPSFEPYAQPVAHLWLDLNNDGVLDDAHSFYFNYLSLNSAAGAAGGYYATPSDLSRWMRSYMRGDVVSPAMMAEAKTVINASGSQGGKYGLGLMRNTFQGLEAYGHGGDLAYAASSWYITDRDISISVLMNHNGLTSWNLLPVVSALLKTYNNWLLLTSSPEYTPSQVTLRVYPNPCREFTTVSFPAVGNDSDLQLVLRNGLGQSVLVTSDFSAAPGGTVCRLNDLGSLSAGMYLIQLLKDGEIIGTSRLVR